MKGFIELQVQWFQQWAVGWASTELDLAARINAEPEPWTVLIP